MKVSQDKRKKKNFITPFIICKQGIISIIPAEIS